MRYPVVMGLSLTLLVLSSCSGKKEYIISERKMAPVLVDIHIADEISTSGYSLDPDIVLDSAKTYGWVFRKHGITKAEFDSSMAYYSEKPDVLNKIYNRVMASISKMDAELAKAEIEESQKTVIFDDRTIHRLPYEDSTGKVPFDVPLDGPGDYSLNTRLSIQRNDQSVNPHITAYYWYDDGTETGVRDYFRPVQLKKSGRTVEYSVSKTLEDPKFTHLRGYILDHDNADSNFVKQAIVTEIKVLK